MTTTMTLKSNRVTRLAVNTYGDSAHPAIIFLHGAGVSGWMWLEQIENLQAEFYCITVDLPGNGDSHNVEWLSFEDTAKQIAAVIHEYSPSGKAHVVGLSLGGFTGLYLLAKHPDVVESLIVSGVTTRPFTRQWLYRPLMAAVGLISNWDVMINFNIRMMNLPDEIVPLYRRDSKRSSQMMLKRVYNTIFEFKLPQEIYNLPQRVLGVAGDHEMQMIIEGLADFNALPKGTARMVPEAHHAWNGEHPALFTAMIRAWLLDQPLPEDLLVV